MSFYHGCKTLTRRFRLVLASFLQSDGLPFGDVLPEEEIERAFEEEGVASWSADDEEEAVYTPPVTLWAFLSQMLHKGEQRSCVAAVARVVVLLLALGHKPLFGQYGRYCRARAKLPEPVIRRLTLHAAKGCEEAVPSSWLWHGRHVKLVDGTTVSMPDTEANQAEYPQHTAQEQGVGFPIMRMVVLFSLATGMLCDMALGPYQGKETGEPALFRELFGRLDSRRHRAGRSLLLFLLHDRAVEGIGHRFCGAAAPKPHGRLSPRPAFGQGGSSGRVASAGPARRGWTRRRTRECPSRSSCAKFSFRWISRGFAPSRSWWSPPFATRKSTRRRRSPNSTVVAGW